MTALSVFPPEGATAVPDAVEMLAAGLRYEKNGMLERALEYYRLAGSRAEEPDLIAEALWREASVHRTRCEWDKALGAARKSAEIARRAHLNDRLGEALNAEAAVHQSRGEFDIATPLLEEALGISANDRIRGIALQNLGGIAAESGDLALAEHRFLESYQCFQRSGYARGEAISLNNYARAALDRGGDEVAEPMLERAIEAAKRIQDLDLLALASLNLAESLMKRGELARAEELVSSALGYFGIAGNRWRSVECLRLLGDINLLEKSTVVAGRCYEQGLQLAEEIGAQIEIVKLRERLDTLRRTSEQSSA